MRASLLLPALLTFLALLATPLAAQTRTDLQPVPDAPPQLVPLDPSLEPQVTIIKREKETVEEHRVNGRLVRILVNPSIGEPYELPVPPEGGPALDGPGSPGLVTPQWVIHRF